MKLAVVMCTWQRIERLPITLELLSCQRHEEFAFFIWNNNLAGASEVDRIVGSRNWGYPITVHHSPENIGGFGRFEWCRRILAREQVEDGFEYAVFFDDDQEFGEDMLRGFATEAAPATISSRWSYRFEPGGRYWDRHRSHRGEPAHYCGTCGMVTDLSLFEIKGFFADCPAQFRFVEDLWLSFYAQHVLGWKLVSSGVRVRTIVDGKDQYLGLRQEKSAFLRHLRGRGWQV